MNLSIDALYRAAAMLPRVVIARTEKVIGKDTVPAMQSGLYWGYVSLIDGIIARIKKEYGKSMNVIATGGLASRAYFAIYLCAVTCEWHILLGEIMAKRLVFPIYPLMICEELMHS